MHVLPFFPCNKVTFQFTVLSLLFLQLANAVQSAHPTPHAIASPECVRVISTSSEINAQTVPSTPGDSTPAQRAARRVRVTQRAAQD